MNKGILYYTDNRLNGIKALGREVFPWAQKLIKRSGLPITSVSLKPIDFGKNIVLNLKPNVVTMTKQILAGLEAMTEDVVFFAEHDILYHPSHYDFTPTDKNTFYFNSHGWKWDYRSKRAVYHDKMVGLYGLCAYRDKLLEHYARRLDIIYARGYDKEVSRNPRWMRVIGYEPGKPTRNGGISNDRLEQWRSKYPNINVRHRRTVTPKKMDLRDFIHKPTVWKESEVDKIDGWEDIWN
jgi:hypothetical protein